MRDGLPAAKILPPPPDRLPGRNVLLLAAHSDGDLSLHPIAAYYSLVVLQVSERFRCVMIYAFFYLVVPLFMRQNLLREFFGACMAAVAASAVFTLFILLVFALSILQFSSYLVRGRP